MGYFVHTKQGGGKHRTKGAFGTVRRPPNQLDRLLTPEEMRHRCRCRQCLKVEQKERP